MTQDQERKDRKPRGGGYGARSLVKRIRCNKYELMLLDGGLPIRSTAHPRNGRGFTIGCKFSAGTLSMDPFHSTSEKKKKLILALGAFCCFEGQEHNYFSLAQELSHEMNRKCKGGNVLIKLDMTKATTGWNGPYFLKYWQDWVKKKMDQLCSFNVY